MQDYPREPVVTDMADTNTSPNIMIIAGEVSGDMHAAQLVKAVKQQLPDATFFGIGGDEMKNAGVEVRFHVNEMAVMGLVEVFVRYLFFRRVFNSMVTMLKERKPDAVILVDYPGFNLRFAAKAHAHSCKVIYYVCPQVWAWNRSRIPNMARIVDQLITIFPFEKQHFSDTSLSVDFAGHPLVDEAHEALATEPPTLPWNGEPRIAILPGSRQHEVDKILPTMWGAARLLQERIDGVGFIVAAQSERVAKMIRTRIDQLPGGPTNYKIVTGQTRQVLRQASAALIASGTATIEAALMTCPMVITYRVAPLTYFLGKLLVKIDHIGMVNIVAEKEICPEFIQGAATPEALADAITSLISDTPEREAMLHELREVQAKLGEGDAANRAARLVIKTLE